MITLHPVFASTVIIASILMSGASFAQAPATPSAPAAPTVKIVPKANADAPAATDTKKMKSTKVRARSIKAYRYAKRTMKVARVERSYHKDHHHELDGKFEAMHSQFDHKMHWLHKRMKECGWM